MIAKRPTLKVSKTDAAKRQLETAVRLWFFSGDPVSIHTLAAAGHQILHDVGRKRGVATILRELPGVRPDKKRELRKIVSRYENFFKHADQDPDALLDFNPEATELYLLDAILAYEVLTQEVTPILATFKAWIFINNPQYMETAKREKLIEQLEVSGTDFKQIPKVEFFKQYHALLIEIGLT